MAVVQLQQPPQRRTRGSSVLPALLLLLAASPRSTAFLRSSGSGGGAPSKNEKRSVLEECPPGTCEGSTICAVDPCLDHSCRSYEVCQSNLCGGCHAICDVDEEPFLTARPTVDAVDPNHPKRPHSSPRHHL